ncbi:MAG: ATP-binding protein, partial [Flavobacteriaceae bacterium]|nr:ATP-binding protein [Flavobacteriaceae bacterium]
MRKLNITSSKKTTDTKEVELKKSGKFNLLGHIEKIVELAKDSALSDEFFAKAKTHINFVKKTLQLNEMQTVLFTLFIDKATDSNILISDMADFLKCRPIRLFKHNADLDVLESRHLIRCRRSDREMCFHVPMDVFKALINNKKYEPVSNKNISVEHFFDVMNKLFDERNEKELTYTALVNELDTLIDENQQLNFVSQFKKDAEYLEEDEKVLLLRFCNLYVENSDDCIGFHDFTDIFEHRTFNSLKTLLKHNDSALFDELIENVNDDGFEDRESFKLTQKAKDKLFSELNIKQKTNKKGLLFCTSLSEKKMFYNESEHRQVKELTVLLQEDNFNSVRKRLAEKGMRTGFACLFHGSPGTGKTETVYQIARQTGRDIFLVDISQTKSKWFGESEKKIKDIFERYRAFVKRMEIAPILLFNEADAVICKRKDVVSGNLAQVENAIQNIILQEMETLDGIMIATTNMTENLDKAFERRFLYKIEFGKPNAEAKKSIWQSIIPTLTNDQTDTLAEKYNFSGGQIENIARKSTIDHIISGKDSEFDTLIVHC